MYLHITTLVSLLLITHPASAVAFPASGAFPTVLKDVLGTAGFSNDEIQKVRQGEILKAIRKSPHEREIVLSFACLIQNISPKALKDAFLTVDKYEEIDPTTTACGLFQDGSPDELKNLKLEPNGKKWAAKYCNAKPGSEINLSQEEIASFNELKESSPGKRIKAVEEQLRQMLLARLQAYRERGMQGIVPYARSKGETLDTAQKLLSHKTKLTQMIEKECPAFYRHFQEYPKDRPDGLEESFSWYNLNADGTPTFVLSHRMGRHIEDGVECLSERIFYNSCILNYVQSTGAAVPVENGGTVLVFSMRASTDMVTGFGSAAKRKLGTKMIGSTMMEQLKNLSQLT